jgi:hypothetical protein
MCRTRMRHQRSEHPPFETALQQGPGIAFSHPCVKKEEALFLHCTAQLSFHTIARVSGSCEMHMSNIPGWTRSSLSRARSDLVGEQQVVLAAFLPSPPGPPQEPPRSCRSSGSRQQPRLQAVPHTWLQVVHLPRTQLQGPSGPRLKAAQNVWLQTGHWACLQSGQPCWLQQLPE